MPQTRPTSSPAPQWLPRALAGGFLMGLANLVPGISGGTMLLAAGIYTRFIDAVAAVTRGRFERSALLLLGAVVGSGALAILLLAGPVKDLVVEYRWGMYSLFVGLTLGGIPALWRMARPSSTALWWGAGAGFVAMALLGLLQRAGAAGGAGESGFLILVVAGSAGAASMILPGLSGGYILLVLGQYVTILSAIESATDALRAGDISAMLGPLIGVFVPVGLGIVVGVALISNLLRWCLANRRAATLGVLLGLLVGAVVGLWPFQRGVSPEPGTILKGEAVTEENRGLFAPEDWPVRTFRPSGSQMVGALLLMVTGYGLTLTVSRLGRSPESGHDDSPREP